MKQKTIYLVSDEEDNFKEVAFENEQDAIDYAKKNDEGWHEIIYYFN